MKARTQISILVLAALMMSAGAANAGEKILHATTTATPARVQPDLAPSPFGGHVHALAFNPHTEELFLGARPIYRSGNGGKSWTKIEGIPKRESRANITSIAIDPVDGRIMYATGHGMGVVKSTDAGRTWTSENDGLEGLSTEGFAIDAKNRNMLYVWVLGKGLYRSKDAAASWQRVDDGPRKQEIRSLVSVNSPTGMGGIWLYAGLDTGVVKSPDCFCGWDKLANEGLPEGRVYSLVVDRSNPTVLYAGLRDGVYKTTNGGKAWRRVTELVDDAVVAIDPAHPNQLYAIGADGSFVTSVDAGDHWTGKDQSNAKG